MPQRVYSTRFLIFSGTSGASFELPQGYVGVLKDVTVCSTSPVDVVQYGVYLMPAAVTVVTGLIPPRGPEETQRSETYETRVVFYPGESLHAYGQLFLDLTASGYVLELS